MDKKIYYEIREEILELKNQQELFKREKEKEEIFYNEIYEMNDFCTKKMWIFAFKIAALILTTMTGVSVLWNIFSPQTTIIETIIYNLITIWFATASIFNIANIKRFTKQFERQKEFNILSKDELKQRQEKIELMYKKVKNNNKNKQQELERIEQEIHEKIINLPMQIETDEKTIIMSDKLEEYLNEQTDYKNIHLEAETQVEIPKYNKKLTKVYKNDKFML